MKALLLVQSEQRENTYGRYAGEILRAEGLNWFQVQELAAQTPDSLAEFALVILTRCFLAPGQVAMLADYVRAGGRLICFRPAPRLGQALGLEPRYAAQEGGTVRVEPTQPVGLGLCSERIQFHGLADHWQVPGSADYAVGALLEGADGDAHPALAWGQLGRGKVAVFTYDLPSTVAAIRQGDPARANTLSGQADITYRASELFMGHLDESRAHIPQADIHMALLVNVVDALMPDPLPRLWYYPQPAQRSVLVLTSDDDWSQIGDFEALMEAAERRSGHVTFYLVPQTRVSPELAQAWAARGHEISVHPDFSALHGPRAALHGVDDQYFYEEDMLAAAVHGFERRFGAPVRTIRQHCIRWKGYVDAARTLANLGVEMDVNYYSIQPFMASYMTGSGRPMRFVDERGALVGIFQQPTMISEDTTIGAHGFSPHWSTPEALARVEAIFDASIARTYTPVCVNAHPISFTDYSRAFIEGILDLAHARQMPIVTAAVWLDFTQARYAAEFEGLEWHGATLTFGLRGGDAQALTVAVPTGGRRLRRSLVEGQKVEAQRAQLYGREMVLLPVVPSSALGGRRVRLEFETL